MKKTIKIIISFSLLFTIFNCGYLTQAKSISNIEKVANVIGLSIDLESKIDMYNEKEEIVASYYSGTDKGYLIVNANSCEPLEYSFENNIDFIEQNNGRYYYAGLLNYYKRSSKNILVDARNNTISYEKFKCKDLDDNFDISTFTKQETRALTTISYVPRAYSYNPNGICGATAAAILLMYYDDHINVSYVPTAYESSGTGQKTVLYVSPYIKNGYPGATYEDMYLGLNLYLHERGFSTTATILSTTNLLSPISNNRPVIVGLAEDPTYGNHWVVGYGYNRYTEGSSTIYMIVVSDGWGRTGVYINRNYADGGIKI